MKILVVEDEISVQLLIKKILISKQYEISTARNGEEAFAMIKENKYDLVITDWMMPKINGLELTRLIKSLPDAPCVIMETALDSNEAKLKAIESGADDFIAKPFEVDDLINRVDRIYAQSCCANPNLKSGDLQIHPQASKSIGIGIAASTGGPQALRTIIADLGFLNNASVFIVLQGPSWMIETFKDRLQDFTRMKVHLAENDMPISDSEIYLAKSDNHLVINPQKYTLELLDTPPENFAKPSADPLFLSIANTYGKNSVGIVLSGIGKDGSIGAGYIAAKGGKVIAETPSVNIIHSMPQTVIDLKIANKVLDLLDMGSYVAEYVKQFKFS